MIGRVCVKLTGREAGKTCVIVNEADDNFVFIDGNVKRRKCNIDHLEFTDKVASIKKNASTKEVLDAMRKIGLDAAELKQAKKESKEKPNKIRSNKKAEDKKNAKTKR